MFGFFNNVFSNTFKIIDFIIHIPLSDRCYPVCKRDFIKLWPEELWQSPVISRFYENTDSHIREIQNKLLYGDHHMLYPGVRNHHINLDRFYSRPIFRLIMNIAYLENSIEFARVELKESKELKERKESNSQDTIPGDFPEDQDTIPIYIDSEFAIGGSRYKKSEESICYKSLKQQISDIFKGLEHIKFGTDAMQRFYDEYEWLILSDEKTQNRGFEGDYKSEIDLKYTDISDRYYDIISSIIRAEFEDLKNKKITILYNIKSVVSDFLLLNPDIVLDADREKSINLNTVKSGKEERNRLRRINIIRRNFVKLKSILYRIDHFYTTFFYFTLLFRDLERTKHPHMNNVIIYADQISKERIKEYLIESELPDDPKYTHKKIDVKTIYTSEAEDNTIDLKTCVVIEGLKQPLFS